MEKRKWLPHFPELIDRLSIHQLKEVFIPKFKEKYAKEMKLIVHDLNILIEEKDVKLTGEMIRAIIVLSQMNTHIWYNESKARQGLDQELSLLKLTHGLNGLRVMASNCILEMIGQSEKCDIKTDCLAAEFKDWDISLRSNDEDNSDKT